MTEKLLFKINKEKWDALIKLRGWEHPVTQVALRTGFSKSYISQVLKGGVEVSNEFMLALIKVSGASVKEHNEWAGLFDVERSLLPQKGQNYAKMRGERPYTRPFGITTPTEEIRRKDRALSLDRLKVPDPIPAINFYDDAIPKRVQTQYRYR